jgi:hypothetical protein
MRHRRRRSRLSARAQYSSSQRWSSLRSLDAVVSSTIHSRSITLFTLRKRNRL